MSIEWFENDGLGVAIHTEDSSLMIIGDYIPDWIKLPKQLGPPEGGRKIKVIGHKRSPCPGCTRIVRHLQLEDRYGVAQCKPGCGFVFYRWPKVTDA